MQTTNHSPVNVVGIGASAGGLEAIETFFKHMPDNSGVAFVVIQHLSPDHKSLMAELLSKRTLMPVHRAEGGMSVEPNCVYLIPPNKNLRIFHGKLLLSDQNRDDRGINLPIDIFFRSLAEDYADKAIAIVLSGTGSDGTTGIRAIKENLGMVMAQAEETAAFDGMPRSAIATGLVDYILPPDAMPAQLLSYLNHPYTSKDELSSVLLSNEDGLSRIFALLRERNKIDFTYYKPSTIIRRIERRMAVNQINELQDYVRFLESYNSELDSLNRDLLIGVTSFFRDQDAFDSLRSEHLPKLLKAQHEDDKLRLWVVGCSTGEEAYSLAILCLELMEQNQRQLDIKIFATDVDREAIVEASSGIYAESSVASLDPALLSRYFYPRDEGYQISRQVREMVVFAQHNIIKDPPFTNIDLISCRNLLIYLQPVLQKRVLELFNFALNPQGLLFLGSSETTGEMSEYFEPLEAKFRIYQSTGRRRTTELSTAATEYRIHGSTLFGHSGKRHSAMQIHEEERMLERFIQGASSDYLPFSLLVNERLELLHVVGQSQQYLRFQSGKMINDVTKLVTRDLGIPLSTGLQKVFKSQEELNYTNIHLRTDDHEQVVNMRIRPLPWKKGQEQLAAVFIEPARKKAQEPDPDIQSYDVGKDAQQRINDLENELQFTRENLQATVEELETSNEELQATNEELLASNEELQSTNEELQSVNEELYTVNSEYQGKITELTEANNDLDNLLKNTRVATLFLDENLDIRRFTPETSRLFRIMEQDIGRPLSHLSHEFVNLDIIALVSQVQRDNQALEQDVKTRDNRSYLLRIYPYQIAPQTYTGLVLTLVDISNLRRTEASLAERKLLHSSLLSSLPDIYLLIDAHGLIREANRAATSLLGYDIDELLGQNINMLMNGKQAQEHDSYLSRYLQTGETRIIGTNRLVTARHKMGHPLALVLSVTRIDVGNEVYFAGLLRPPVEQIS
jgi:two-component system CheB/CheR fusion protein